MVLSEPLRITRSAWQQCARGRGAGRRARWHHHATAEAVVTASNNTWLSGIERALMQQLVPVVLTAVMAWKSRLGTGWCDRADPARPARSTGRQLADSRIHPFHAIGSTSTTSGS